MGGTGERQIRPDDFASLATIVGCFACIILGKETATATSVLMMATGFLFGKHTRKKEA